MKVIDLIIKLSSLPPDMDILLDHTNENMEMFKYISPQFVDEIEIEDGKFVVLSHIDYDNMDDQGPLN